MNQLLGYVYKCNKKKLCVLYVSFITVSLTLFFYMSGSAKRTFSMKQETTLILFTILIIMAIFSIFLLTISSFKKIINNSMIRYTAISAKKYLYANIIFFLLMLVVLAIMSLVFLELFSSYISEVLKAGDIEGPIKNLHSYGLAHYFFSIFLWAVDLTCLLTLVLLINVIIKWFNVKPGIGKILFFVFFVVFAMIYGELIDLVGKIGSSILSIRYVELMNSEGYFETSFYPGDGLNIFSLCFEGLLTFVLILLIAYIIDKKLEI
ncbi:ABC transporter permease [Bacillus sp. C1]